MHIKLSKKLTIGQTAPWTQENLFNVSSALECVANKLPHKHNQKRTETKNSKLKLDFEIQQKLTIFS